MTTTESKPAMTKAEVIYLGQRMGSKGKPLSLFITPALLDMTCAAWAGHTPAANAHLTEAAFIDHQASPFDLKKAPAAVGGVYEIDAIIAEDRISSINPSNLLHGAGFKRGLGDATREAMWQALHKAGRMTADAAKAERHRAESGALDRVLDELALIYRRMPTNQRTAFKLMVLNAMEKGGR